MSLSGALTMAADDLVEFATPIVARFGKRGRLVAQAEGEDLALYDISPAGAAKRLPAGARPRGHAAVELRLPAGAVLAKRLTLPAAGRDFVEPILDHRLERLTPWAPDRAIYGWRVAGDGGAGELEVDFAATSRDIADRWVGKAEAAGLSPTALGAATDAVEEPLAVDLWRGGRDPVASRARKAVKTVVAGLAVVLLPLVALSFWTLYSAEGRMADIEARSTAARLALQRAAGAGAGSREASLIAAKRPDAAMVVLVDKLARTVPQDTVLRDLEIGDGNVRLAGFSAAAPQLIKRLEDSGLVRGARFTAPVTRTPDGRDAFEIVAARVGVEPPAAATAAAPASAPAPGPGL